MLKEELIKYQAEDETLESIRAAAMGKKNTATGDGFLYQDILLYCCKQEKMGGTMEQLVLPAPCQLTMMRIAHEIPLGGHLGRKKTVQCMNLLAYSRPRYHEFRCKACQLDSSRWVSRAPPIKRLISCLLLLAEV